MLERMKENHSVITTDDVTKTMKKCIEKLKKSSPKEDKLDALTDILELSKVLMDLTNIGNDEYFNHLNSRRVQHGTFSNENKE